MIPIVSLSIEQAIGFKYWDYSKFNEKMNYFLNMLAFSLIFLICITPIIVILYSLNCFSIDYNMDKLPKYEFIVLAILFAFCTNIYRVLLAIFRNEKLIFNYSLLNIMYFISLIIGSIIGVIVLNNGIKGAIEGRSIGFIIVVAFSILLMFYKYRAVFTLDVKIIKPTIIVAIPLLFSQIIGNFSFTLDRLIIEKYLGLSLLGIYSLAYSITYVLDIMLNALSNTIIPDLYEKIKNNINFDNSIIYGWFDFSILISSFFGLIGYLFINFFISSIYHQSLNIIIILSLTIVPKTIQVYYNLYYFRDNKTQMLLYLNIINLLISAVLYLTFGMMFSIIGISIGVLSTSWIGLFISIRFLKTGDKIQIKKYFTLSVIFISYYLTIIKENIFEIPSILASLILILPLLILIVYYIIFEKKTLIYYSSLIKKNKNGSKITNY